MPRRCNWVPDADPAYVAYHDDEWGVPSRDDRHLFEMLTLEGAQAGPSWSTILRKRDGYRDAFAGFDAETVARFDRRRVERLLRDPAIVRNRLKVESTVNNARCILEVQEQVGGLAPYVWQFVDGTPIAGKWRLISEIPTETAESKAMSKHLKRRGFRFVGPTGTAMRERSRPRGQRRRARRTTSAMCGVSGGGSMRSSTACSSTVKSSLSSRPRSSAPT